MIFLKQNGVVASYSPHNVACFWIQTIYSQHFFWSGFYEDVVRWTCIWVQPFCADTQLFNRKSLRKAMTMLVEVEGFCRGKLLGYFPLLDRQLFLSLKIGLGSVLVNSWLLIQLPKFWFPQCKDSGFDNSKVQTPFKAVDWKWLIFSE